jgi:hypothetical protein
MLKTDIPQDQIDLITPILEPLLARLRRQIERLPPQADSALVYSLVRAHGNPEAGQ